jgi:uncharacterized protein (DUF983 family)
MHKEPKTPSTLSAFWQYKCPQCRRGPVFKYSITQSLANFSETHESCSHCGLRYEIEPGFFWGAAYIAYAFVVAHLITSSVLLYLTWNPDLLYYIFVMTGTTLLCSPFYIRISRMLMLYLFAGVKFDKQKFWKR